MAPAKINHGPLRVLMITAISIFIAETLVMFLLFLLPPFPAAIEALIDASLLTVMVFPILYILLP